MCYNKKHRLPFVIERQFFMDENLKKGRDQAMEEQENKLGTAPIGKLLVQMSLPAITAQVINALYNIVDRIYIGHLPEVGSLALASLGVSFPLIMIISAFAALIGMGGAPRAAIAMGAGKKDEAEKILGESVRNLVSLEAHASLDKTSICRNLLLILGIFCCRIFLLLLV